MLVVLGLVGQGVRYPIIGHGLITAPCYLQFSVPHPLIGLVDPASKSTVILQPKAPIGISRYLPPFSKTVKITSDEQVRGEKTRGKRKKEKSLRTALPHFLLFVYQYWLSSNSRLLSFFANLEGILNILDRLFVLCSLVRVTLYTTAAASC